MAQQYVTDPSSGIQYNPSDGTTPNGGNIDQLAPLTGNGKGGGSPYNAGASPPAAGTPPSGAAGGQGLVGSFTGYVGQSATTVVVGLTLGTVALYLAGIVAAGPGIIFLIGLLAFDILFGGVTATAKKIEEWFNGTDANGNPVPGSPFAPGGALAGLAGKYLGDAVIAITVFGVAIVISKNRSSGGVTIIEQGSSRPRRTSSRRRLKRVN